MKVNGVCICVCGWLLCVEFVCMLWGIAWRLFGFVVFCLVVVVLLLVVFCILWYFCFVVIFLFCMVLGAAPLA